MLTKTGIEIVDLEYLPKEHLVVKRVRDYLIIDLRKEHPQSWTVPHTMELFTIHKEFYKP